MATVSSYFCFNCGERTTVDESDLTCGRCGGGFIQEVTEAEIPSLAEETLPVFMDPRIIPRFPLSANDDENSSLDTLLPIRDALNDFARTLGSSGPPPVLNDRHASHNANRHALSLGFRLVRSRSQPRESAMVLRSLSSVVEELNHGTETLPALLDSDDDDMPGLEPNEEHPNDLRSLFQPVRVHLQISPPHEQTHVNLDPQILRMMVQQATNPTAYQNLTQQLFTQTASSFERVNSVLVELVSNMLRQEQGIPPVTEEQLPYIPVHPVDSTMLEENPTCAVCLEPFTLDQSYKNITCLHRFHPVCLDRWLLTHGNCPVCRTTYSSGSSSTDVIVDTPITDNSVTSIMDTLD